MPAQSYELVQTEPHRNTWRRLGGLTVTLLAFVGLVWHHQFRSGPVESDVEKKAAYAKGHFLELDEGGVGGCAWGVHCEKTPCCTEAGFTCVRKTKWWSACEKQKGAAAPPATTPPPALVPAAPAAPVPPAAPAAPVPAVPPAIPPAAPAVPVTPAPPTAPPAAPAAPVAPAVPAAPATTAAPTPPAAAVAKSVLVPATPAVDCTESKHCSPGFVCTKRTDGMWWKSICVKGNAAATTAAPATPAATTAAPAVSSAPVRGDTCGVNIPDLKNVQDRWDVAESCARELVSKMSMNDKVALLHGQKGGLGFAGYVKVNGVVVGDASSEAVRLTFNDGPEGYNGYAKPTWSKGTQYPDLLALAASFDPPTAGKMGAAVAEEFRAKGCSVLLGPAVDVVRTAFSGRSFESLSGEDPYLGSELAWAYVTEVQRRGIISTVKHWLDNNQELNRQQLDVHVDSRAQHEVYMRPFEGAIRAGAGAVMCSYNKVYGEYACGNHKLIEELLRKDLGFRGFVVSDWGAVHDGAKAANGGLNMEMPEAKHFKNLATELPPAKIDRLASQVLASVYAAGQFQGRGPRQDWKWPPPYYADATSEAHDHVARDVIISSTVLLKNRDATLPLEAQGLHLTLVGDACRNPNRGGKEGKEGDRYASKGSGFVATQRSITPLEGLQAEFGADAVSFSADGSGVRGNIALICAAAHSKEGEDRADLKLPDAEELISAVKGKGAKKVIVLAIVPGAIETEWVDDVDALLVMFMPGEQIGAALAKMLSGKAGPGGRLPVSFPKANEQRFTPEQYPGVHMLSSFTEGVLVGYKWNDAKGIPAAFPFGFGLSYADLRFTNFSTSCDGKNSAKAFVTVTNMGTVAGVAVPQLYVGFKSLLPVVRQLRGFRKVHIPAGFQALVTFSLSESDWSFFDAPSGGWKSARALGEEISISLGSSSADLYWRGSLHCH